MAALPRPTLRTIAFWILAALVLMLGVTLGNQDLVWPALFLVLLPVVALLALLVLRPRFTLARTVVPGVVGVREPAAVEVVATAVRATPGGHVVAEDDPGAALGAPHHARLYADRAGATTETTYGVRARRRGRHTLDGFRIRFTDVLGFWVHTVRIPHPTPLVVTPAVVPLPASRAAAYGVTGETPIPQTAVSGPDDVLVRE